MLIHICGCASFESYYIDENITGKYSYIIRCIGCKKIITKITFDICLQTIEGGTYLLC